MQVALKVVGGKNDGREIAISIPRFIIGRGDQAHLRPTSDLVSREHCAITIENGKVSIIDLDSRNGTFVNSKPLKGAVLARPGDSIRIGRLQFQLIIDQARAGVKRPKVNSVAEAASRTAQSKPANLEESITDWLMDDDDADEPNTVERQQIATSDTIQLNMEDTTVIRKSSSDSDNDQSAMASGSDPADENKSKKKKDSKPLKLPKAQKDQHECSTSAADDVLKKFFNRR